MPSRIEGPATRTGLAAGGFGALVACCTVKLIVLSGLLAGVTGAAIGGMALGAGLLAALAFWWLTLLANRTVRRHGSVVAASCPAPAPSVAPGREPT